MLLQYEYIECAYIEIPFYEYIKYLIQEGLTCICAYINYVYEHVSKSALVESEE